MMSANGILYSVCTFTCYNKLTGGFMQTIYAAITVVILDQLTKYMVTSFFDLGETLPLIPGIFHLTYIINPGAAFGIFPHQSAFSWVL